MDASLRRKEVYAFDRFRLDSVRRLLTRDGVPIPLSPKLFDTLLHLVENSGRVVEKGEIMNAVWPDRFVEESNLSQTIFGLRKALSVAGEENRFIETVPGHGYRFMAAVEVLSARQSGEVPSRPLPVSSDVAAGGGASLTAMAPETLIPRDWAGWLAIACTVLLLIVATTAAIKWNRADIPRSTQPNIVVLADFQNLTRDPVFGAVLDKVLEIDLAQSPLLDLLPPQRVSQTLQLMERPRDAKLTPELAQEVCSRNGGKAMLSGAVASAGSRYIVTLEARDCVNGNAIAESKADAARQEDVPDVLDGLSARMREALNESLASIRKFDVPIAQATTSSFEALKDFSLGEQSRAKGDFTTSIPLLKRAIELDPSFALAYEDLGADYAGLREPDLVRAYYQKAFALSARASENEKLRIAANYYQRAGNFDDAIRAYQLWTETYPRDWMPWSNLTNFYTAGGRYEEAVEAGKQALRLNPENSAPYTFLARAYKRLTRFAQARAVCRKAIAKGLDGWDIHGLLYEIAFAEGDTATMAEQVAREKGKPTEGWMLDYEALAAATAGKLEQSRSLFDLAIQSARQQGPDAAGEVTEIFADYIDSVALLASQQDARKVALDAEPGNRSVFGLAEIGEYADAAALATALRNAHPGETELVDFTLPAAAAEIDLGEGKPQDAIAALQPAASSELREFWTPSLFARAYLELSAPARAVAEYRRILVNRGVDGTSPLYPLAWLGLGRALHMEGRSAQSRAAYEKLFAFWKNADSDLPILQTARREYAELAGASQAAIQ